MVTCCAYVNLLQKWECWKIYLVIWCYEVSLPLQVAYSLFRRFLIFANFEGLGSMHCFSFFTLGDLVGLEEMLDSHILEGVTNAEAFFP